MNETGLPPDIRPPTIQESTSQTYQPAKTNWTVVITIIGIMILSGAVFIFLAFFNKGNSEITSNPPATHSSNTPDTANSISAADQASIVKGWQTFDNVRQSFKNHDTATYNELVAVPEPFCKTQSSDCTQFMDAAYDYLSKYQQQDFVNTVEDNKQLALWNNPVLSSGNQYEAVYLYFTKNSNGDLDFLSMENKTFNATSEQAAKQQTQDAKVTMTKDADGNGYWDILDKIWSDQHADAQKVQNNTPTPPTTKNPNPSPTPNPTYTPPPANNLPPSSSFIVSAATDQTSVRFDYYFQIFIKAWKNRDGKTMSTVFGYSEDYGQNSWDFKDENGIWAYSKYVIYKSKITAQDESGTHVEAYYIVPDKQDSSKYNILIINGNYDDAKGTAFISQEQVFPSVYDPKKYSTKEQIDKDIDFFMK